MGFIFLTVPFQKTLTEGMGCSHDLHGSIHKLLAWLFLAPMDNQLHTIAFGLALSLRGYHTTAAYKIALTFANMES